MAQAPWTIVNCREKTSLLHNNFHGSVSVGLRLVSCVCGGGLFGAGGSGLLALAAAASSTQAKAASSRQLRPSRKVATERSRTALDADGCGTNRGAA